MQKTAKQKQLLNNIITEREIRKEEVNKMKIFGKYYVDQNFITICSNGTIYTVARNSGQIGRISIGEYMFHGGKLTQEGYA